MDGIRDGEHTPEFVRWTIGQSCSLREEYDWTDPEQTERLLRPIRALSDARRERRTFGDVVFAAPPPLRIEPEQVIGFVVSETLAVFGGEAQVAAACGGCPANVPYSGGSDYAGCYGMFYLADAEAFQNAFNEVVRRLDLTALACKACHGTNPIWYGLWLDVPLAPDQMQFAEAVFALVAENSPQVAPGLVDFVAGLRVAQSADLPVYARLIPAGRVQGNVWKLCAHCKRCRAPRNVVAGRCPVCGAVGQVCAGRSRKLRGQRPFLPLVRQLGAAGVAQLVNDYNGRLNSPDKMYGTD